MPRPKKDASLRKADHLRIPVTADQKELVQQAALQSGQDFAPWARAILLRAAMEQLPRRARASTKPSD